MACLPAALEALKATDQAAILAARDHGAVAELAVSSANGPRASIGDVRAGLHGRARAPASTLSPYSGLLSLGLPW